MLLPVLLRPFGSEHQLITPLGLDVLQANASELIKLPAACDVRLLAQ
jgi:hypothetical protein